MKKETKKFLRWLRGYFSICFCIYFIASGLGAFVVMSFSAFDITEWGPYSRFTLGLAWLAILAVGVFRYDYITSDD